MYGKTEQYVGLRLGWWEAGLVGGDDSHTIGDLGEGYAGDRNGVILLSAARRTGLLTSLPLAK